MVLNFIPHDYTPKLENGFGPQRLSLSRTLPQKRSQEYPFEGEYPQDPPHHRPGPALRRFFKRPSVRQTLRGDSRVHGYSPSSLISYMRGARTVATSTG